MSEPRRASSDTSADAPLLEVKELAVAFRVNRKWLEVVRSASLTLERGEILGVVGESGSGKTVTAMAITGLVRFLGGRVTTGQIVYDGTDLTTAGERQWAKLRGREIGMIFQQPTRSLNPAFTVGDQIAEGMRLQLGVSKRQARARAVELLDQVRIPDAKRRANDYPHTFSGGMCQRVMIAMALACEPRMLIADEPTTALDVTVQAKILELLREIQADRALSIIYVSHDLGVIAELCDRVTVMYAGETVESGRIADIFHRPTHPYTSGLLRSIPEFGAGKRLATIPGQAPAAHSMPTGCRFHPRCEHAVAETCTTDRLELRASGDHHTTRCVRHDQLHLDGVADVVG